MRDTESDRRAVGGQISGPEHANPKTEHRSPGVNPRNWRNRLLDKDLAEVVEAVLHLLKQ